MQRFWQLFSVALALIYSTHAAQAFEARYFYIHTPPYKRVVLRDFRPSIDKIVFDRVKGLPKSYYAVVEGRYLSFEDDDTSDVVSRLRHDGMGDIMIDLAQYGSILLQGVKITELSAQDFMWRE